MASAFKPTYVRAIPDGAERCRLKGRPAVRYTDRRGKHVWPMHLDGDGKPTDKMVCEQSCWWLRWTTPDGTVRRAKGFADKTATEQEAARREREAQLSAAGVLAVDEAHLSAPLAEHIGAYVADLERAGRVENYYETVDARLRRMADACGWGTLRTITPDSITGYLATMRREGYKPKTTNDFLAAAKGFCGWCVRTRRLAGNPLECVQKIEDTRDGSDKAALTREQAAALLNATTRHRLLYLVALRTGLRRSELRALQWGDVYLDGPHPHIELRAAATKARRADTLPLKADVAGELRQARPVDAKPGEPVFASMPTMSTFRADLDRAGIPHHDERGRKVCLHSLRVTFGTWLAMAGTAPRVHMELMRHTNMRLTMTFYTDPRLLDTSRALADLPDLDTQGEGKAAVALRTGTDDMPVDGPEESIDSNRVSECPEGSTRDPKRCAKVLKTPVNQGSSVAPVGCPPSAFAERLYLCASFSRPCLRQNPSIRPKRQAGSLCVAQQTLARHSGHSASGRASDSRRVIEPHMPQSYAVQCSIENICPVSCTAVFIVRSRQRRKSAGLLSGSPLR